MKARQSNVRFMSTAFCAMITIVFGSAVLFSGLKGTFEGFNRYMVGSGCVLGGLVVVVGYVTDAWKNVTHEKQSKGVVITKC